MEKDNSPMIQNILREMSMFNEVQHPSTSSSSQLSSNSDTKDDPVTINQGDINEKYFFHKLKHLLKVPEDSSFQNVHILMSDFIKNIKLFIHQVIKNNIELKENESSKIVKMLESRLQIENKIEINSFFMNVPGYNLNTFLQSLKQYSFPLTNCSISEKKTYTILVESTHSLKSTIIKKTNQIRKYYSFFNSLDEIIQQNPKYFENFHEFLIEKYFRKSIVEADKYIPKANFSFSKNYVILIATDHSFKFFGETIDKIKKSKPLEKYNEPLKRTFPELAEKEKKMYKDEINNDDKNYLFKKKESFEIINFLIDQINMKVNWIVKIVYFDIYFDMIVPKCVIENGINILQSSVENLQNQNNVLKENIEGLQNQNNVLKDSIKNLEKKNNVLKDSIKNLEKKNNMLNENIESLQNQNKNLSNKFDNMILLFTKLLPGINISELIKEINNPKK